MMKIKRTRAFSVLVAASVLLTACVTSPKVVHDNALRLAEEEIRQQLPRDEVSAVLASGFYNVSERALTDVNVRQLGLEGMRGLATIDPEIQIDENSGMIEVRYGDDFITAIIEPLDRDTESWADAVYDVLLALWPHSSDLAQIRPERVYEAVFDAALSNLDIFSRYAGRAEAERHRERREGFGSVDMELTKLDERIMVSRVGLGGPADVGGVQAGDILISVDGEAVIGKSRLDVETLLRGKVQTEVTVVLERPQTGVTQKLFLWRELQIPQTVWSSFEDGILSLRVTSFNEKTVQVLSDKIQDMALLHGERFQGVILDLRGNPGGLLKKAVQVADLFLSGGRIISTQGRHPDSYEIYDADRIDVSQGRPLAVLLDGKSASASEIVAAALQDRDRAVVIGSSSYGKGTVQSVQRLPNDGEITVTWSRLIAPSGYAFHGLGVRPSVCTSGVQDNQNRGPALFENEGTALMATWRSIGIEDRQGRRELRQTCPPDQRRKGIDSQVARNILLDSSLYQRFMGATTIATVAQ